MYNELIKEDFISSRKHQSDKDRALKFFRNVEEQESCNDMDIAIIPYKDLIDILRITIGIYSNSSESIRVSLKILEHYRKWYADKFKLNYDILDFPKIKVEDIDIKENYPYKFFKDAKIFSETIYSLADKYSTNLFDYTMITGISLLIFNGLSLEAIRTLKSDNVDCENQIIYFSHKGKEDFVYMIPEFVNYYKKIKEDVNFDNRYKAKDLWHNVDYSYFIPVKGEKRIIGAYMIRHYSGFLEFSKRHLEKNLILGLPIVLKKDLMEVNGLLYRSYLQGKLQKKFVTMCDQRTKNLESFFDKFIQCFYS